MVYYFYFGNVLMPVTPSALEIKVNNKNKTIELANGGEINILKPPGLSEISFDLLIPTSKYSFALYENGFKGANYYLDLFEYLKKQCKSFEFKVIRSLSAESVLRASAKLDSLYGDMLLAADVDGDGKITATDARTILRNASTGESVYISDTTMIVTLESYTIKEDVKKYGQDFYVQIKLKQFVSNTTKQISFK